MTIWQWIKSLFGSKNEETQKENNSEKQQVKDQRSTSDVSIDNDPFCKTVNQPNESIKPVKHEPKFFDPKYKKSYYFNDQEYLLTDKQIVFYEAIKRLNQKYPDGVYGFRVTIEFLKNKYGYSNDEILRMPKDKLKIGAHYKTLKYLISSGLIIQEGSKFKASK